MKKKFLTLLLCAIMILNPIIGAADIIVETDTISVQGVDANEFEYNPETQTITGYKGTDTDIEIPDSIYGTDIKHIGNGAFGRKSLTSVIIPDGIETIGDSAFAGNNLEKLVLPESIVRIGRASFGANVKLKEVYLNEGLEYIGQQAFTRNAALVGTVEIPSTVHTVMTTAFDKTGITTLKIKGDNNSTPIVLKSVLSRTLTDVVLENPYKKAIVHFNTFGCDEKTNTINLGTIETMSNNIEALKTEIEENIKSTVAATYVNTSDNTGESDILIEFPIIWDYSNADFTKDEFEITGQSKKLSNNIFETIEGYTSPQPDACKSNNIFKLKVKIQNTEIANWDEKDFNYDTFEYKGNMQVPVTKWGISGLSEAGLEKLKTNPDMLIPKTFSLDNGEESEEKPVEGIINGAFSDIKVNSVVFPQTIGEYDFIIQDTAFRNSGLKSVVLSEGVKAIGSYAFYGNELDELVIPSTVLSIGNSAFQNNNIESLIISDDVDKIQIDNYSFANNKLKEVKLPYSIFKFLKYVFKGNPGLEKLDSEDLEENDPEGTGVVYLYTRNKAHLGTETYIALSKYHKIINTAEGIDRSTLWETIRKANAIDLNDYKEEAVNEFSDVLIASKKVFFDSESTQDQIDNANNSLMEAIGKLRASSADKTALRDLINRAEEFVEELFTVESYANLKNALIRAKEVSKNIDATTEDVNNAISKLQNAIDRLEISENAYYTVADFNYEGNTITGFSESGKEKFKVNKDVYLPDENADGTPIEIIGVRAFRMDDEYVEYGTDVVSSPYGIKNLRLPKGLKRIEEDAFRVNNLGNVELPKTLEYIGNSAFNGNQLTEILIPDSVKELGLGAFSLNLLKKVTLSKSLTEIADGAFSRNIHLKNIDLHEGLTVIGASSFMGAPLTELHIPSSVTEIKSRAFSSHRLEKLKVPGTVKTIGNYAFEQNTKFRTLTEVDLRNGIEEIGNYAFRNGLIIQTELPKSLIKIGNYSFRGNQDSNKNEVIVKLYTSNEDHLSFNNDNSLKAQEVIYDPNVLDKNLLDELGIILEKAKLIDKNKYTAKSYQALNNAINKANQILAEKTTDDEIKAVINSISDAISKLVEKPKPKPSKPHTPTDSSKDIEGEDKDLGFNAKITQIAGENRYKTAIEISSKRFNKAENIILVSGKDFADALTAQPLTQVYNGPLLLSSKGDVQEDILAEIKRLSAKNIIVVGGTNSVTEEELESYDMGIKRIAGIDRYETAENVARLILENLGNKGKVIIADGRNYPDALSIAPYATKEGIPILLSKGNVLSEGQRRVIEEYGIKEAIIVGGINSVGNEIESLFEKTTRIAGTDRYETAAKIAGTYFADTKEVFIASGENYPDALVVSYYASYKNAPILLSVKDYIPMTTKNYILDMHIQNIILVGGQNTINSKIYQ